MAVATKVEGKKVEGPKLAEKPEEKKEAKKRDFNKSEAIRAIYDENTELTSEQIAEELKKRHNQEAAPATVATVISNYKKKLAGGTKATKGTKPKTSGSNPQALAAQLIKAAGGVKQAEKALAEVAEIAKYFG